MTHTAHNDHRRDEPGMFTILIAVVAAGLSREGAERTLHQALPAVPAGPGGAVDAWWIAEDTRYDRSDNDSAVFVPKGRQGEAVALLRAHGLTT